MEHVRDLIDKSEELLSLAEKIQDEENPPEERAALPQELYKSYHDWYYSALTLFDNSNQQGDRQKFVQEYEGSVWSSKIIKFLTTGLEINPFYNPDEPNPLISKWTFPFPRCFREPLLRQRSILAALGAAPSVALSKRDDQTEIAWSKIEIVLTRFHQVARQLRQRHNDRPTLGIEDEYDVQDLLHALLRLFFDDIREEEWTPSYAGGASRVDFLLKSEKTAIEVKKTRPSLTTKEIGDQLIIDIAHYQVHPDCESLVCFVYDPDGHVRNAAGLENDLSKQHGRIFVKIYIVPKG
jgi:hypothetical protein